jgi:hypothetical protein
MSLYVRNIPMAVLGRRDWRRLWLRRRPSVIKYCHYGIDDSGAVFTMEFTEVKK